MEREHWDTQRPFCCPSSAFPPVDLKKKEQRESWEFSVIWGKMKTAAWETTPQVVLRNCSKEVGREGQYIQDFGGGGIHTIKLIFFQKHLLVSWSFCLSQGTVIAMKDISAFLDMGRYKNWRRAWQPTPVFLPRESHGQRNLVGHSP